MHVLIVIPTFNHSRLLPQTIPALALHQSTRGFDHDVIFILVTRSSSDGNKLLEQRGA
jgi:hypothetical protein